MDCYVVTHNYQSSLLFVLYLFIYSCFFSSCMRIENIIKKKLRWDNFILLRSKNPIWYTMFLKRNNYSWQNGSTVRTLVVKTFVPFVVGFFFLFLSNYLPFIVSSSSAKVAALPWFDLNLNFGASYICRVGPYTPAPTPSFSLSLFLSFSPSTPTFIQWITSLVATFRGLLIPAGQIIQIGLLRSCPNLMSVMLLYPLHTLPPSCYSFPALRCRYFHVSFSGCYGAAAYFPHISNVYVGFSDN